MMNTPFLFSLFPKLQDQVGWMPLMENPTPVQPLNYYGARIWVKREDLTAQVYGGNKVRNLEFILGTARRQNRRNLITIAPKGSNFIAALAAQARRVGMKIRVRHFTPANSPQINAHYNFSRKIGGCFEIFRGRGGILPALFSVAKQQLQKSDESFWVTPGGSSPVGALGHVNAALELSLQVKRGEVAVPDFIVVGAGTCGTMAGLLVGLRLAGLSTKVLGVRCVDSLVCNRLAIAKLANATLSLLGSHEKFTTNDIHLTSLPEDRGYGRGAATFAATMTEFYERQGIELDTTYTSKVVFQLQRWIKEEHFSARQVLYWHTFSPAAMAYERARSTRIPTTFV